ncbi:hypothetical protein MMC17_007958 [Xylographa soralifera]|nr:hypothetical protein [Xylographa soralifera]
MSFSENVGKVVRVHRRKVIFLGGVAVLAGLQYTGLNPISSVLKTPGVQNIEHRYSSGGGSKDHLPGAATPRGNPDNVEGNTVKHQGVGSSAFGEHISSQKPDPSGFDKAWNKNNYGAEKGK